MESWASSAAVRKSMQGNRSRDTSLELALRRELHRRGLRFRVNVPVPGMPRRTIDIAWQGRKVAVFCDGCYWHGCPRHSSSPKTNAEYWTHKIDRNRERDSETTKHLELLGWKVLRFWGHQDVTEVADRIEDYVRTSAK